LISNPATAGGRAPKANPPNTLPPTRPPTPRTPPHPPRGAPRTSEEQCLKSDRSIPRPISLSAPPPSTARSAVPAAIPRSDLVCSSPAPVTNRPAQPLRSGRRPQRRHSPMIRSIAGREPMRSIALSIVLVIGNMRAHILSHPEVRSYGQRDSFPRVLVMKVRRAVIAAAGLGTRGPVWTAGLGRGAPAGSTR
jgi:hypothetical protein